MKCYTPCKRHQLLDLVLQYDSFKKEIGKPHFFTDSQRFLINQERAKIMQNDTDFTQNEAVIIKIAFVVEQIKTNNWNPPKPIEYK